MKAMTIIAPIHIAAPSIEVILSKQAEPRLNNEGGGAQKRDAREKLK